MNSNYSNSNDYRYLEDYSPAVAKPRDDENQVEGFDENFDDSTGVDDFSGVDGYTGSQEPTPASFTQELSALQNKIKSSGLPEEVQKGELEKLDELQTLISKLGPDQAGDFEDKLGAVQEEFESDLTNQGDYQTSKQALDDAEAQVKASSFFTQKQKEDFTKQIKDAREALLKDPEFNPKDELSDLFAALDEDQNKTNALKDETERSKGKGDSIAGSLDQMFHASGGIEAGSDVAYGIDRAVGPLGFLTGMDDAGAPHSKLYDLPPSFQDLDLIMHGESKLGGSTAPGDVIRDLYDMSKTPEEQLSAIKKDLNSLPLASQAMVLGLISSKIGSEDPEKLSYLAKNCPEILDFMKSRIKEGQDSIKNGELASSGNGDYNVSLSGMDYSITNQDTHWYTNDWDDFSVSTGGMLTDLSSGLRSLNDATTTSDPAAEDTSTTPASTTTPTTEAA